MPARGSRSAAKRGRRTSATAAPTMESVDGIEFRLTRKRVKNVNLRVRPNGAVEVSAPAKYPLDGIKRFVSSRREWIERTRSRYADSPSSIAEKATERQKTEWRDAVSACVPALIQAWEPILGVKAGKIAYRNMKSRWGSCQPATGRICINTRLALYPPKCLEYVVVHELCHLLVHGHGEEFHRLMDSVMPDWRERSALLR